MRTVESPWLHRIGEDVIAAEVRYLASAKVCARREVQPRPDAVGCFIQRALDNRLHLFAEHAGIEAEIEPPRTGSIQLRTSTNERCRDEA